MKIENDVIKTIKFDAYDDDLEYAKKLFKHERIMLKMRLVCIPFALCWSVFMYFKNINLGVFENVLLFCALIGIFGTLLTCLFIILRFAGKMLLAPFERAEHERYYEGPGCLFQIFFALFSLAIVVYVVAFLPFIYCILGIIQSSENRDNARVFLYKHIEGKEFLEQVKKKKKSNS